MAIRITLTDLTGPTGATGQAGNNGKIGIKTSDDTPVVEYDKVMFTAGDNITLELTTDEGDTTATYTISSSLKWESLSDN